MNGRDPNKLLTAIILLCFLFFCMVTVTFTVFTLRFRELHKYIASLPTNETIHQQVDKQLTDTIINQPKPANGQDGKTVRGPKGDTGERGPKGNSVKGPKGDPAKPCTTSDIENGAIIKCPDGSTSTIEDGEDAREREDCLLPLGGRGWRYIGTFGCLLPRTP